MPTLTLAQNIDPKVWFYFALLLAMIFVGALAIFALRRSLLSNDELTANQPGGGLMEHLDEMRRSGQVTNEEYEVTRKTIIDKAVQQMDKDANPDDASDPTPNHTK